MKGLPLNLDARQSVISINKAVSLSGKGEDTVYTDQFGLSVHKMAACDLLKDKLSDSSDSTINKMVNPYINVFKIKVT